MDKLLNTEVDFQGRLCNLHSVIGTLPLSQRPSGSASAAMKRTLIGKLQRDHSYDRDKLLALLFEELKAQGVEIAYPPDTPPAATSLARTCQYCYEEKPLDNFYPDAASMDGLYVFCKPCSHWAAYANKVLNTEVSVDGVVSTIERVCWKKVDKRMLKKAALSKLPGVDNLDADELRRLVIEALNRWDFDVVYPPEKGGAELSPQQVPALLHESAQLLEENAQRKQKVEHLQQLVAKLQKRPQQPTAGAAARKGPPQPLN